MARRLSAWLTVLLLTAGATIGAQIGTIVGTITSADDRQPLAYTAIAVVEAGREVLANAEGQFSLTGVKAGAWTLRVRRIGFTAFDTTIHIAGNQTVRVNVALVRIGVRLDGMRVVAGRRPNLAAECVAAIDPVSRERLLELLEQVMQNAEQYRLLVREQPFWLRFSQFRVARFANGRIDTSAMKGPGSRNADRFTQIASGRPVYEVGKVFRRVNGVDELFVPEIQDFASDAFIEHHCFEQISDTTVNDRKFFRVRFTPIRAVAHEDVSGVFFLRENYSLAAVEMKVTGVPARFAKSFVAASVYAEYRQLVPGIAVLSRLESVLETSGDAQRLSHGEVQELIEVTWQKRRQESARWRNSKSRSLPTLASRASGRADDRLWLPSERQRGAYVPGRATGGGIGF